MEYYDETKEELLIELKKLQRENISLKESYKKDLVEIHQAEEKLRNSEGKYRLLIDRMPDGVYKTTDEGKFINANPAMFKMLGYDSKEELMSIDIKTQLYFEISDRESSTLNEKNKELGIYRLKKKDGSEVWVEDHGWLNYDKTTDVLYHEGIMRDITERKKGEEALLESERRFRLLYENAPLAYQSLNTEGCLIDVNPAWLYILGYKREEVLGKHFGEFMTPQSAEFIKSRFPHFIDEGEIHNAEFEMLRKDGSSLYVSYEGKIGTDEFGNFKQTHCIFSDITDRKRAELELIKSKEKAQESDRLKSAFLANMSHEIRTPMNGILGFSELLKKPNLSGEKQQRYIEVIEKSGKRMLNIINDIIDISKIEAGLVNIEIKESNVNEQIEYIYTFFKPEVEAKGMQLYFKNTLPAKEAIIKTDREKLFAILTNLVKNAIKYAKKGSIEFGYVLKMGAESVDEIQNNELEFFVKDTGIGIPKDRQEAIFERFIQADIINKMARQGAGLGLSITKAYVEMLGGKIRVESEEGIGSTFYFTLPYNVELKEKNSTKNIEFTDNIKNLIKNLKILIVEDDEASEMLLSINLSDFSNEIIKARTGLEAIEACRNNPDLDLILMDIQMPDLNGYEATRQIRQFNKDVVIIAQTAYGLYGDMEKSLDAGCNDYISKPINKNELDSLIQKYFNKSQTVN